VAAIAIATPVTPATATTRHAARTRFMPEPPQVKLLFTRDRRRGGRIPSRVEPWNLAAHGRDAPSFDPCRASSIPNVR
jgi:hypothetical protein